ncbi:MAG TPA: alpha/beta hydrolase [Myxococcota bacterium]|nr:alpha/beta hydrolase [Myxococcota bacterium]HND32421.1 alpha/beta hydrolase [Myxococcota bacterium]HNH45499.1 alpha/beta hydrolase [Myxococcota bacterium]
MPDFHPDLLPLARFLPEFSFGARSTALLRWLGGLGDGRVARLRGVRMELREIETSGGHIRLRILRPEGEEGPLPAVLWIHGGGLVIGFPAQDDGVTSEIVRTLRVVVVAVQYRLAPQHPYPAALDDCAAALRWMQAQAPGIRPDRIAVAGVSAGGGLAAALCLRARAQDWPMPVFQLLVYPMLDDRTVDRPALATRTVRIWSQESNRFGWSSYLGAARGSAAVPAEAASAREVDLRGLPPAWIGVGTLDLFLDEDVDYATRLRAAGVPCTLVEVPGAYHGFDTVKRSTPVARSFFESQLQALRAALSG